MLTCHAGEEPWTLSARDLIGRLDFYLSLVNNSLEVGEIQLSLQCWPSGRQRSCDLDSVGQLHSSGLHQPLGRNPILATQREDNQILA